jgi:hypothetical protein
MLAKNLTDIRSEDIETLLSGKLVIHHVMFNSDPATNNPAKEKAESGKDIIQPLNWHLTGGEFGQIRQKADDGTPRRRSRRDQLPDASVTAVRVAPETGFGTVTVAAATGRSLAVMRPRRVALETDSCSGENFACWGPRASLRA